MVEAGFLEHDYSYAFASRLDERGGGAAALLELATTVAPGRERLFFSGAIVRPELGACLLLAISEVALQRYYTPFQVIRRAMDAADPVVSASGSRLRFESFSRCCGVYARADFLAEMLAPESFVKGVTNVDFNPETRAALARVRAESSLYLRVTPEAVALTSERCSTVERKVKLPLRWLRGFAEVQSLAARLECAATLDGPQARRFLASLPSKIGAKDHLWLAPAPGGVRLSQRPGDGAVSSAGLGRLSAMKPLARHAIGMRIYGGAFGVSAFELDFGVARFLIVLSAAPSRGFSGEGQLLAALMRGEADAALARIEATLRNVDELRAETLAAETRLPAEEIATALALLATRGAIGFDPRERVHFHRELPFDRTALDSLHPRLKAARALVAEAAVTVESRKGEEISARVRGSSAEHRVKIDGDASRCTCAWHSRTGGESGPCKHILATLAAIELAATS